MPRSSARVPFAAIVVALAAGIAIGMLALHRHAMQQLHPDRQPRV
jgi:hypothetical protein